ncbi:hypothetical protein M3P36_10840 [Altererythrobacter sp. KTW20L]|uniref:hypothetical protein n=1 Tax=Altererythrobacter sp. KTW20L TaxID=2942210 RepID=UPI0020BDF3B2|nr:hypothetical protein [Altererythrobacter sp. KTW20L]MCL6251534.1 hypothetical protein [Altererythrobacter sp. KTW20L]
MQVAVIQPFSAEQERALINMRQRYDGWIEAERELYAMPYDLKRKKIAGQRTARRGLRTDAPLSFG